ncbi:MAG TPA: fumarylacetoacetate hydrolase family protein [Steroidobacteraceae bacterium]|nr:fumarylacetoacetate hydrolase family protein [Steroidobacteraceae bacterium]
MMDVPNLRVPTVDIAQSSERFPVRRIFCVGQNYADHAREMGSDPERQPPFFFSKPADAVVASGRRLPFPSRTADLHHEVELVVALSRGGANVKPLEAPSLIFGYAVGIDLTRRDMQAQAKKAGRPWDMSKGFDHSAPVGPLTRGIPPAAGAITLTIDGNIRQSGDLKDMIWSVADIIACLSTYVAVAAGDLVFTGTPAGVGPILRGQQVRGTIAGIDPIDVTFE